MEALLKPHISRTWSRADVHSGRSSRVFLKSGAEQPQMEPGRLVRRTFLSGRTCPRAENQQGTRACVLSPGRDRRPGESRPQYGPEQNLPVGTDNTGSAAPRRSGAGRPRFGRPRAATPDERSGPVDRTVGVGALTGRHSGLALRSLRTYAGPPAARMWRVRSCRPATSRPLPQARTQRAAAHRSRRARSARRSRACPRSAPNGAS